MSTQSDGVRSGASAMFSAMEWCDPYMKVMKEIAHERSSAEVEWKPYVGGAVAILDRIRRNWPDHGADLMVAWDGTYAEIAREGWAEPVTEDRVPNLKDVPKRLLYKDDSGNVINVPRSIAQAYWFYREDISPIQINSIDDFLDPRLKGKICMQFPRMNLNMCMLSMALAHGGDERNMEPAWEFVTKLARSGNIGRVVGSLPELVETIGSGETCVGFECGAVAIDLARSFKIRHLMKMPPSTGFGTYLFTQGWYVLKGPNTNAAFDLVNTVLDAEVNGRFNNRVGALPVNSKASVTDEMKFLSFTEEEMDRYGCFPDWQHLMADVDPSMKRWQEQISPLLKAAS